MAPQTSSSSAGRGTSPDITVIIPTYNRLWCLPDAVASCRSNLCTTEIIVVDDGSTDGSWEWLSSQPELTILRQPNGGKCRAVNRAFSQATGRYVRFLDSDDLLPPGANDIQLAAAEASAADVVVAGYEAWFQDLDERRISSWVHCDDFVAQQLGECDSSHYSAYLFRKVFLKDICHRPEYAFRDDRMFVIEVAFAKPRVTVVDRPCLIHRHHARERLQFRAGLTASVTYWQELQIFRKSAQWLEDAGELTPRRQRAIASSLWPLIRRIGFTDMAEAAGVLRWAKTLDPAFQPPAKGLVNRLHRLVGFSLAQRSVNLARWLRGLVVWISGREGAHVPRPER